MNQHTINRIFMLLGVLLVSLRLLALPAHAGLINASGDITCESIAGIFQSVINIVVTLAGIAFFLMMLIGGLMYMMAAGNPDGIQRAQQTIVWGVIGTLVSVGLVFIATTAMTDIFKVDAGGFLNINAWICGDA